MKYLKLIVLLISISVYSCKSDKNDTKSTTTDNSTETELSSERKSDANDTDLSDGNVIVKPISHGTLVLEYGNVIIYVDPVGGAEAFKGQKPPTYILVTDIHGDHLDIKTLEAVSTESTKIIAPHAVADQLPSALNNQTIALSNAETKAYALADIELIIEAIPMYNLREEALQFHPKKRGNGYVLTLGEERVYISGDTEDIPEMRRLKDIDIAFVCMNLPYTMPVKAAADAVLDFKPKKVYPYHYRGTDGLSDVELFKSIVNKENELIEVILVDWYKKSDEV
ncbi:MBL fold metallo-hydrolase [Psychroserpens mesophilus]|uniref:MBL fold metallo-hydrolase n=1 Tax=Psychroserpens mesophilus TaxID=325473 RepID=UPI00058F09D1|nr:MBL fold metallo-hydrolase [Psychroserpens mesophilus]